MAGITITNAQISEMVGTTARDVRLAFQRVRDCKEWLDTVTAGDLETLYGFSAGDAAIIKSAYADLAKLADVFEGTQAHSPAADMRAFVRQLWGLGVENTTS